MLAETFQLGFTVGNLIFGYAFSHDALSEYVDDLFDA